MYKLAGPQGQFVAGETSLINIEINNNIKSKVKENNCRPFVTSKI